MSGDSMPEVDPSRTAIIITAHPELLDRLVSEAGYEIVGEADTAFSGERLVAWFRPDVVVIENELTGIQGWEALPDLKAASPDSQLLLVVAEGWTRTDLGALGAFAVVTRAHLAELVGELEDLDAWIAERSASAGVVDRRSGRDRRQHQDWSRVGFEKRRIQRRAA